MKKSLTFWNTFPVFLIIAGVLWLIFHGLIKRKRGDQDQDQGEGTVDQDQDQVEDDEPEITREERIINNYKVIRNALPQTVPDETVKILTAQAMHETGVFTSRLYKENNNLFGMRQPTIRETLSTGGKSGWANFATLEDSANDLLLYFKEFSLKPTWKESNTYVKAIKAKGYFEDNYINYFNAVRTHLSKVKTLIQ